MASIYLKPIARLGNWLQTPLELIRAAIDAVEVRDPRLARFLCRRIPARCPFERDIILFGYRVMHIPALCKLNPFYEQLVRLRLRALSFLAERGDDISHYL